MSAGMDGMDQALSWEDDCFWRGAGPTEKAFVWLIISIANNATIL
jgi:hypothetical protein